MPKSTSLANAILALLLNGTAIADLAENDATSPLTNLYIALHTSDPGIGGSQTTNETAYTNYVRVAVARSAGGWTGSGGVWSNAALIQFAQCGITGATITHVSIGTASSGAGLVLWAGALSSSLAVANLIRPQFDADALEITET